MSEHAERLTRLILSRSFEVGKRWAIPGCETNPARAVPRKPLNNARERFLTAEEAARLYQRSEAVQHSALPIAFRRRGSCNRKRKKKVARRFRLPDALPPLKGWAATIYLVVWVPLLAITLWLVAGTIWYGLVDGAGDAYAFHALGLSRGDDDGALINRVAGDEARRAGLRPGDRIVAYGGVTMPQGAITDAQEWRIKARLLDMRGPVGLRVQSGKDRPRLIVLTRSAAHGDALYAGTGLTPTSLSWLGTLTNLLAPAILITGAGVLFARRRDAVAALLSVTMLGLAAASPYAKYYIARFDAEWLPSAMSAIGSMGLLLTLLLFPNGRLVPRWTLWAVACFPVSVAIRWMTSARWLLPAYVLLAIVTMVVRYSRETKADRRQWRWAMIGFVIGIAIMVGPDELYFNFLASKLASSNFNVAVWSWVLTPLSITLPLTIIASGVMLSVLRYRLYDTQAAVSRSILYGALTLALLAIFAGSEKLIEIVGEEYFGESMGALAGGLGAAFAAVAISPLHHRLSHWVEHRFRKNLIHLRHDLPSLLTELGETSDPTVVARTVLDHVSSELHATRGAVILNGAILATHHVDAAAVEVPAAGTRRAGAIVLEKRDPLFPVRLPLGADGRWLLIGPRPDGSLYDRQEREILSDLAPLLAHALRVAADRTTRATETADRFDRLELELRALQEQHRIEPIHLKFPA